jgi:hypothetical protein
MPKILLIRLDGHAKARRDDSPKLVSFCYGAESI